MKVSDIPTQRLIDVLKSHEEKLYWYPPIDSMPGCTETVGFCFFEIEKELKRRDTKPE